MVKSPNHNTNRLSLIEFHSLPPAEMSKLAKKMSFEERKEYGLLSQKEYQQLPEEERKRLQSAFLTPEMRDLRERLFNKVGVGLLRALNEGALENESRFRKGQLASAKALIRETNNTR